METFVSTIWDPNYIRIGNYEYDMVADLNVKIGNLLNTNEKYISRRKFRPRPNTDVRPREYTQPANVRRSQRIHNRNRRPNEQNPPTIGGSGRRRATSRPARDIISWAFAQPHVAAD